MKESREVLNCYSALSSFYYTTSLYREKQTEIVNIIVAQNLHAPHPMNHTSIPVNIGQNVPTRKEIRQIHVQSSLKTSEANTTASYLV